MSRTELEIAWAAGFFDGEGSIFIAQQKSYSLRIEVGQKIREPLEVFMRVFDNGRIYGPAKDGCYQWRATSRSAGEALELMLPYLIVKRAQAEVALSFQSRRTSTTVWPLRNAKREADSLDQLRLRELKVVSQIV